MQGTMNVMSMSRIGGRVTSFSRPSTSRASRTALQQSRPSHAPQQRKRELVTVNVSNFEFSEDPLAFDGTTGRPDTALSAATAEWAVGSEMFADQARIEPEVADHCNLHHVEMAEDTWNDVVETKAGTLCLMRHGESFFNSSALFSGDVDIPLTEAGIMEAMAGGKCIADLNFDVVFTSRLQRAKMTAMVAMTQNQHQKVPVMIRGGVRQQNVGDSNRVRLRDAALQAIGNAEAEMLPVYADPALNERCYGDLQGLNKHRAAEKWGEETVRQWRRSYDVRPPGGESLRDTAIRSITFFEEYVCPQLAAGKNVLLVAHGNVLRCLTTHIAGLTVEDCLSMDMATATPLVFRHNGAVFEQYVPVVEPANPLNGQTYKDKPKGLASVLKNKPNDSLI